MKRRLFNLVTALSLLLCVAAGALWMRSQFASDAVSYISLSHADGPSICSELTFLSAEGIGVIDWRRYPFEAGESEDESGWDPWIGSAQPEYFGVDVSAGILGFHWSSLIHLPDSYVQLAFPLWAAVLLPATLPAIRLYRRVRRPRKRGQCPRCGYDLRATPDRCPECGTAARPAGAV